MCKTTEQCKSSSIRRHYSQCDIKPKLKFPFWSSVNHHRLFVQPYHLLPLTAVLGYKWSCNKSNPIREKTGSTSQPTGSSSAWQIMLVICWAFIFSTKFSKSPLVLIHQSLITENFALWPEMPSHDAELWLQLICFESNKHRESFSLLDACVASHLNCWHEMDLRAFIKGNICDG